MAMVFMMESHKSQHSDNSYMTRWQQSIMA
jgi:hypothetical protein